MHRPGKISVRSGNDSAARPRKTETLFRLFVVQLLCFALFFQSTGIVYALPSRAAEPARVSLEPTADLPHGEAGWSKVDRVWDRSRELVSNAWGPLRAWIDSSRQVIEQGFDEAFSVAAPASRPEPVRVASLAPSLALLGVPVTVQSGDVQSGDVQAGSVRPPTPPRRPTRSQPTVASVGAVPRKATGSDVSLLTGFNLVSIPDEPPNTDPATVLAGIHGQLATAFAYDACDAADPWKLYDPADPAASDLTAIDHTQGLWLDVTSPAVLPVTGAQPATTQIQLCTGWNLIGYPLAQARPVSAALASIAGKYLRVFGFELGDSTDPWEVYDVAAPGWANDLQLMQRGRGYWVLVTEDTTLDYENTGAPPVVEITSPTDLGEVTAPTDVIGTVESNSLDFWTLSFRPSGEGASFVEIGSGNVPGTGLDLGPFDPTLLLNGMYDLKLEAVDFSGQIVEDIVTVVVDGQMKVGKFTLSYLDLAVPVSGLAIEIRRTYDSRDKRKGDFGFGWSLDIRQGSYRNNRPQGDGWQIQSGLLPCQASLATKSHESVVRLSDQEVYRFATELFDFAPTLGGCFAKARFTFIDGPQLGATLTILGNDEVFWENDSDRLLDIDSLELFEPEDVRLTTRDERVFDLDLVSGVTRLADRNGNMLTIDENGISHSSGLGIQFERDIEGRILRIVDPRGGELGYTYDAAGDLTVVADQELNTTRFSYNDNHGLLEITDARGITPVRNEYDGDGRLVSTTDAFGKVIELAHDLEGRQDIITDRLGHARVLEYDERGNVVRQTDRLGRVTTRTFDAEDNLLTETNPLGQTVTMVYDSDGDLTSISDPLGNAVELSYNARGELTQFEDARGGIHVYDYDANGNLSSRTDAGGHEISFAYDARGQLESVTDALGNVTAMTYNSAGHLTRKTEADGAETHIEVDAAGNPIRLTTTRTTPGGVVTEVTELVYDGLGRLTERRLADGSLVQMVYGGFDDVEAIIDPLGRRTDFTHDAMGRLSRVSYPDNTSEQRGYDLEGRLTAFTNRSGQTSTFTYDADGQLTGMTLPDGSSVQRTFDAAGRLLSETSPTGGVTSHTYDAAGRRVSVSDALGNATSFTYDTNGSPVTIEDPSGDITSFVYDALGRLTRTDFPGGTSRALAYDALGRLSSETTPGGVTTQYGFDPMGRLLSVTDALGNATQMTYDERGNRAMLTDANGHVTRFEQDALGRLIKRVLPDGASETFSYDAAGNRTSHTDPSGRVTNWRYDVNNRVVEKTLSDGTVVTFTYTATGRLATMTDSRGATTYSYDDRDRLVELTDATGARLNYGYDADSRRTSLTAAVGGVTQTTEYGYDLAGRLTSVVDPEGGSYDYAYDATGRLQSLSYPNGISTAYQFDALDQLMGLTVTSAGGAVLHSEVYQRNDAGSQTSVTELDGTVRTYAYDLLQRLTGETVSDGSTVQFDQQFVYDAVGNRVQDTRTDADGTATTTYTYDARDRLLSAGTTTYGWDANGNLLHRDDGTRVDFTWDAENRLATGSVTGGITKTFTYDGKGRRVGVTAVDASDIVERRLLVDPSESLSHVVVESDESDVPQSTLVRGIGLLAELQPGGTEYQHTDGLGTIRLRTDATGSVVERHGYRAFGEPAPPSSTADGYRFTGEPYDADLGLAYHRARWLDPAVGRFTGRDPFPGFFRQPGTLHRYAYVQNNPLNRIDPSGLFGVGGYIGLAVGLAVFSTIALNALTTFGAVSTAAIAGESVDGLIVSGRVNAGALGGTVGGGADAVFDFDSSRVWVGFTTEIGLYPLSIFKKHRAFGRGVTGGFIVNMDSPRELTGRGSTATWPMSVIRLMPKSLFNGNKAWGLLSQLAKRVKGGSGWAVSIGFSTSGPSMFQVGLRSNDFAALAAFSGEFVPHDELDDVARAVFDDLAGLADSLKYIGPEMTKIINNAPLWFEALSRGNPCTSGCS